MTEAIIAATYSDLKLIRSRKVLQLVFEIPIEAANQAMAVLGGMPNPASEKWCAIARLDPSKFTARKEDREAALDTTTQAPAPLSHTTARAHVDPARRLAQRAGMLCSDRAFQNFLHDNYHQLPGLGQALMTEDGAAYLVRSLCEVSSRSEIVPGTEAGRRFEDLYDQFILWRDSAKFVEPV